MTTSPAAAAVRPNKAAGRPLVVGEFGCCTYQGAADRGGSGLDITDHSGDKPHINGDYVRDEAGQASTWNPDPRFNFDMASYSLVRSFASRVGDLAKEFPKVPWDTTEHGTTYPDMPWEPKESFHAVAARNAAH